MTNMKHRSVSERRARRQRYADAIDPLRQRYNCHAKEVAGMVSADLNRMEKQLEDTRRKYGDSLLKVDAADVRASAAEEEAAHLLAQLDSVTQNAKSKADLDAVNYKNLDSQMSALKEMYAVSEMRLGRQERELELLREENAKLRQP